MQILPRSIAALWRSPKVDGALRERLSAWQRLPRADLSLPQNRRLPETPPFAANVALTYKWSGRADATWSVGGDANYVGRSVLGTGDVLDISQGKYLALGLRGAWERQGLAVTLGLLAGALPAIGAMRLKITDALRRN